jgi:hypothetical protein
MQAEAESPAPASAEREWWLRTLGVLARPRVTFAALRDESEPALDARQEPVLLLVLLAGMAGVLASPATGDLLDNPQRDGLVVAVLVFLAGGMYGAATYWVGGGALALGIRGAGGERGYRSARHVLAFAAAPVALELLTLWPLRIALYGGDLFRTGGADEGGAGFWVFSTLALGFYVWALVLLALGVMTVNRWPLVRSLGALVITVLALVALAVTFSLF